MVIDKCSSSLTNRPFHTSCLVVYVTFMILLTFSSNLFVDANIVASDLPLPPSKPERFTSKQQLKEYLVKLHEYYAIIGRPRFGRSSWINSNEETRSKKSESVKMLSDYEDHSVEGIEKLLVQLLSKYYKPKMKQHQSNQNFENVEKSTFLPEALYEDNVENTDNNVDDQEKESLRLYDFLSKHNQDQNFS